MLIGGAAEDDTTGMDGDGQGGQRVTSCRAGYAAFVRAGRPAAVVSGFRYCFEFNICLVFLESVTDMDTELNSDVIPTQVSTTLPGFVILKVLKAKLNSTQVSSPMRPRQPKAVVDRSRDTDPPWRW